jgi:hypothetical protein
MYTQKTRRLAFDPADFATRAAAIVQRTAQHGLDQSAQCPRQFERWLLIWACDVAAELDELDRAPIGQIHAEVGDVIWGITAVGLLLNIPLAHVFNGGTALDEPHWDHNDAQSSALQLLDICKKICRDTTDVRPIELSQIALMLSAVFAYLRDSYDVEWALTAVNEKLRKRYPDGFSAENSVNRVE